MEFLDRLLGTKNLTLAAVVEETSLHIFGNSVAQIRALMRSKAIETLGDEPDQLNDHGWILFQELIVFSLHLADRIAFGAVGPERRSRFVEALEGAVVGHIAKGALADPSPEATRQFAVKFQSLMMRRTQTYAGFPLAAPGAQSLKGTLLWEAAKAIAGERFPQDVARATLALPGSLSLCLQPLGDLSKTLKRVRDL